MADNTITIKTNDVGSGQNIKAEAIASEKDKNSLKAQKEAEAMMEHRDVRNITICSVHNYSLYRQANFKSLGKRKETIGSCIRSSRTLSANEEEVKKYFPNLIGLSAGNDDFITRVKQYLNNIQYIVTDEVTFNATFIYNHRRDYEIFRAKEDVINEKYDKADKTNIKKLKDALEDKIIALNTLESSKHKFGYPENIEHYLMYRHCLLYRDVAKDLALINSDPSIRFYIKDEQKEQQKKQKLHNARKLAKTNYIEMLSDSKLFNAMLIQYCVSQGLLLNEILLKDTIEKEYMLDAFSMEHPDKFNKMFNDKNLGLRSFIETLIAKGEFVRSEISQNISTSDGEFIGANMNEAVAYFNNPANANVYTAYKNKIKYI